MSSVFEISDLSLDDHIRKATMKVDNEEYLKIRERFVNIVRTMDPTCPSIQFKWSYITIYKIYCKDPAITDTYIGSTNNYDAMKKICIYVVLIILKIQKVKDPYTSSSVITEG